jgi:hypothetical protein
MASRKQRQVINVRREAWRAGRLALSDSAVVSMQDLAGLVLTRRQPARQRNRFLFRS